ncbi:MAG: glycosyltransferase [Candidatus Staskawiczbacteria bacterium]
MAETIKKKYKVLMLAPVPFYYQVPLFQKLAESLEIDFMVYYCSDETIHSADIERMYRTKNKFADPENLLKGYHYNFLKNYSLSPSFLSWPCGLVNFGIWKEIKKNKYDAVILQGWNNFTWWLAFLACSMFKTPVLFMTDANVFKKDLKSKSKNFFKKFLFGKLLFKRAAGFLTTSLVNENLYKTYGVPKEKMIELHYSYGYPNFLKKAKELELQRKDIRKSFGIEESEFVLLFVGRLSKEKNILALLAAYKKIDYKNKKLFIVGDGPLRPQIEKYIKDLKIQGVNLKGFQQREYLINFYIVSDALVLPFCHQQMSRGVW